MVSKALQVLLVVAVCLVLCQAQLTFTSDWGGKRSRVLTAVNCRNDDAISAIYKLVQAEAEKLLFCQKS